jgi:hypothetical protein
MDAEPDAALGGGGAVDRRFAVKRPDVRDATDSGTGGFRICGNRDGSGISVVCGVDADTTNE